MSTNLSSINVRILFFAKTRELSGLNEVNYHLSTPKIVAFDLLREICRDFNLEVIRDTLILAINENYCDDLQSELQLKEGDEIAIIPPISGG
ncbi:molybdopterin synthase sulfur carrier subunit [Calliphora vicina]|uniref:molybdopterin synthase sulfur carrier subunit n=1 Tax=Calliphora vicina TaxID=7373 RepID=UPI00325BF8EB